MAAAIFADIAKQTISLLNAQAVTSAYPTSATDIGTSKRNPGEIKEAVVESDLEARFAICETPGNGFRSTFTDFVALTPLAGSPQVAKLPERIGPVSRVEIKINAADTTWVAGEQCPLNEVQEMIAHAEVFQDIAHDAVGSPTGGHFYIDEMSDFIAWTGNSIRAYCATIGAIDRATPLLRCPDAYSPFLVARSLSLLFKHGDNPSFMEWYDKQARGMMAMIRRGAEVLPQTEPLIRQAA